ncbi:aminotransferase class V-fold PLP-dependent enzyme [Alteromonas sp. 5E99-2]|uniref:aminotransferase class V-fold PLP-dependent enzyme n=1 Tax=Alteromonas sp. 5E99-2 TaxID=2817683 RepID=UPI001A99661C|nr:aminotransferase class V-fold PLP-dependent enzyme [Alteromonas sp. 5E99-2]MBO1255469.1 aminotransferase class V-fold PLP-dependent enzyme [Alteromonas sp. 5E99-2]
MSSNPINFNRRKTLKAFAASALYSIASPGLLSAKEQSSLANSINIPKDINPLDLAQNEDFWENIAHFYDKADGIVNLEHGFWGKMSRPVKDKYLEYTEKVNTELSYYARKNYAKDSQNSAHSVAAALGAKNTEVALTRNATEAVHNLLRQYNDFSKGQTVLYTDIDYPSFKDAMIWLAKSQNVEPVKVVLPPQANQTQILDLYIQAFDNNPNLKLMLLTHVSNQHGLLLPVAKISEEAKKRGIDVICDCAQSWGLVNFNIEELNVDWAAFNLHKWIGSPVGIGALYMKEGSLKKISPYPGELDPSDTDINKRLHTATVNFAAVLTVPTVMAFHQAIGPKNKAARLHYLHSLWAEEARKMRHIEVLGGSDPASCTGMGAFRLKGKTSLNEVSALQKHLETEFGVFTVIRKGLDSGYCIRVTPQVFISASEIAQLTHALKHTKIV